MGDGYVQRRTSGKIQVEQSLTSQVDFGWALWKTQKAANKELYPRRVLDSGGNL